MKTCRGFLVILAAFLASSSCTLSDDEGFYLYNYSVNFDIASDGWQSDFADYPATVEDSIAYGLHVEYASLPSNFGDGKKALMISGTNLNGDLFMFTKKKLTGLAPNKLYTVVFDVTLASNAATSSGIDGNPGTDVVLKVGATGTEPKKIKSGNNYAMNINKGTGNQSGEDMVVLGNIGIGANTTTYTAINLNNNVGSGFQAVSNSQGELWLIVGTDSTFKGTTALYYVNIDVVLSSN